MGETSNANLLTTGSIPKKIIMFAIPLLWGNLFQQLYNVADSLIVGNFLGNNALAAVSSSGNLIFLMVGFFGGIGVGAGVVIARYFGAGEYEKLKKAIHTALAFWWRMWNFSYGCRVDPCTADFKTDWYAGRGTAEITGLFQGVFCRFTWICNL